jgi:hypothetical protein
MATGAERLIEGGRQIGRIEDEAHSRIAAIAHMLSARVGLPRRGGDGAA